MLLPKILIIASREGQKLRSKLIGKIKKKASVEFLDPTDFSWKVGGEDLNAYDWVFNFTPSCSYDDIDLRLQEQMETGGVKSLNSAQGLGILRDKQSQLFHLSRYHFNLLPSVIIRGDDLSSIDFDFLGEGPYVLKAARGLKGKGVLKVESREALQSLLTWHKTLGDQRYILQPFLESLKEWRIYLFNKCDLTLLEKTKKNGEFLGNYENLLEVSERPLDLLPQKLLEQIKQFTRDYNLNFVAADFLQTPEGYVLLEINGSPGLKTLSAIDREDKISLFLERLLKKSGTLP